MDEFWTAIRKRRAVLAGEHQRILEQERNLAEQRRRLAEEIARLNSAEEVLRELAPNGHEANGGLPNTPTSRIDFLKAELRARGGLGRVGDLATALVASGGLKAKDRRSAYNQVYGMLHGHASEFADMGDGMWALAEREATSSGPTDADLADLLEPEPTEETDSPHGDPGWTRVGSQARGG